jgi:membrane protein YdbS with pleckstrin-like domain
MRPYQEVVKRVDPATELTRIFVCAVLAFLLLVVSVTLDGPVSLLAWMVLAVAFLCLVYVLIASRYLLIHFRSQHNKVESHD